ncbi:MAG: hypothetical protein ACRELZ_04830, partial [Candidatus Rokuibacteriota bacterium]
LEVDRVSAGAADSFLLPLHHALQVVKKAALPAIDPTAVAQMKELLSRTRAVMHGRSGEAVAAIHETLADLEPSPSAPVQVVG